MNIFWGLWWNSSYSSIFYFTKKKSGQIQIFKFPIHFNVYFIYFCFINAFNRRNIYTAAKVNKWMDIKILKKMKISQRKKKLSKISINLQKVFFSLTSRDQKECFHFTSKNINFIFWSPSGFIFISLFFFSSR